MPQAFLIHGAFGRPDNHWFPWLKTALQERGFEVIAPAFPTPEGQTLENWKAVMADFQIQPEDIMVGHSLGVPFILNLAEEYAFAAAYLVAGFTGTLGLPRFDPINRSFAEREFDWEKIRKNVEDFHVFHSDNDPYVPLEKGEDLVRDLGVDLHLIPDQGHFNTEAGVMEIPTLLDFLS